MTAELLIPLIEKLPKKEQDIIVRKFSRKPKSKLITKEQADAIVFKKLGININQLK